MPVQLSPEQVENELMSRSVMDAPRSPFQRVTDALWGRTLPEQATSAFTGGVGTLRFMNPAGAGWGMSARNVLPERVWQFLVRHPDEVKVYGLRQAPGGSSGAYYPSKRMVISNEQSMPHELLHAAQDLAGHEWDALPGLRYSERGHRMMQQELQSGYYQPHDIKAELLPYLPRGFSEVRSPFHALQALEDWFPRQ